MSAAALDQLRQGGFSLSERLSKRIKRIRMPSNSPNTETNAMNTEQRIPKGQEPYRLSSDGDSYDMAPVGVLLFACESLHSTKGLPPESPHVIAASNKMVQRVAAQAKRNGCPDVGRWLDQLTAPTAQERRAAADELVSWMTFSEFHAAIRSIKD